jgi:hypothetical protein
MKLPYARRGDRGFAALLCPLRFDGKWRAQRCAVQCGMQCSAVQYAVQCGVLCAVQCSAVQCIEEF